MDLDRQSALKKAISDVLETMFFVGVDFLSNTPPRVTHFHESRISLSTHNQHIELCLKTTEDFAKTITANLLGIDEEKVSQDDLEDSIKELTNMVGGNFQGRLKGNVWQLGIPYYGSLAGESTQKETGFSFSCFDEPAGIVTWRVEPHSGG